MEVRKLEKIKGRNLVVIAPGDYIDEREIILELDSFLKKYPICSIVSEKVNDMDNLIERYALENGISYQEFTADFENYRYNAKQELYKEMLSYGDMLLIFDDGTTSVKKLINEAKERHYCGKRIKIRKALSLSDFTDAFLYSCLSIYPNKNPLDIYTGLLTYVYKQGYYLSFLYKNEVINDELFKMITYARSETAEMKKSLLQMIGIPKLFITKK